MADASLGTRVLDGWYVLHVPITNITMHECYYPILIDVYCMNCIHRDVTSPGAGVEDVFCSPNHIELCPSLPLN